MSFKSAPLFEKLQQKVAEAGDRPVPKAIIHLKITQNGEVFKEGTFDTTDGKSLYRGPPKDGQKADTTLTIDDETLFAAAHGNGDFKTAHEQGKLTVDGDTEIAKKFLQGVKKIAQS